jgi:glycerol-3-phosphate dehydrogenase (NAD(P)+)
MISIVGKSMNISVLGAGAWGTAVAIALTAKNKVLMWGESGRDAGNAGAA